MLWVLLVIAVGVHGPCGWVTYGHCLHTDQRHHEQGAAMESPRLHRRFLLPALAFGSVVAVVAAMTCFGPPACSLADPGADQSTAAFAIPFPVALQGEIARLEK